MAGHNRSIKGIKVKFPKDIKFFHDVMSKKLNINAKNIVSVKKIKNKEHGTTQRFFWIQCMSGMGTHLVMIQTDVNDDIISIKVEASNVLSGSSTDYDIKSKIGQELYSPNATQILKTLGKHYD